MTADIVASLIERAKNANTIEMCEIIANTAKQFDQSIDVNTILKEWSEKWMKQTYNERYGTK